MVLAWFATTKVPGLPGCGKFFPPADQKQTIFKDGRSYPKPLHPM